MTGKEIADTVLKVLELVLSWPVIFLIVVLLVRRQLPALIEQLAKRITKAPGGFEFAISQVQDQLKAVETKVDRIAENIRFLPSSALTDDLRTRLEAALAEFQDYLHSVGFPKAARLVQVFVDPTLDDNAYVDNGRLVLGGAIADDLDVVLHEYAHHVLAHGKPAYAKWDQTYQRIESGLADYLPCSFRGDPVFGKIAAPKLTGRAYIRDLTNTRTFADVTEHAPSHDAGEVWGGVFWEVRVLLGQLRADQLLRGAWSGLEDRELANDDPSAFLSRLTAPGDVADTVDALEAIFTRRLLHTREIPARRTATRRS